MVRPGWVHSMLVADNLREIVEIQSGKGAEAELHTDSAPQKASVYLPELGANLVATLASLDMDDFSHCSSG